MIELSRHIESLLLQHDCVIIPGLGGFITQYVPARYIADEHILLPPYRSVGFNQQLTLNDGLLVQSYMQAYDTNYPETIKLINEAVHQLKETLQEKGEYSLSGIGTLTLGIGGQYNFTPSEAGVLSPDLYGFDALTIKEVNASTDTLNPNSKKLPNKKKVQFNKTGKNYTISVSREIVNYAASIVAAIFFYFLWATPVTSSSSQDIQASSIIQNQLFSSKASVFPPKDDSKKETIVLKDKCENNIERSSVIDVSGDEIVQNLEYKEKSYSNERLPQIGKYTIVLVSATTQQNAEVYVEHLKSQGFDKAYFYKRGKMIRVVYGNYDTENEAHSVQRDLHKHEQFADAWILKK